jgi:hypothetical protein
MIVLIKPIYFLPSSQKFIKELIYNGYLMIYIEWLEISNYSCMIILKVFKCQSDYLLTFKIFFECWNNFM